MASGQYDMFQTNNRGGLSYTKTFKEALMWDDPDLVRIFLNRQNHPVCNDDNETPLHKAAQYGSKKCILVIIDYRYLMDQKDVNEETPLSRALMSDNMQVLQALLDHGKTLAPKRNFYIQTMLEFSYDCYYDRIYAGAMIRALIKEGVSIQEVYEIINRSGFEHDNYYAAVCSGDENLVRLIDKEKKQFHRNVEDKMKQGMLAAIHNKDANMIKLMYELGVSKDRKIKGDHNLLTYAASQLIPDEKYVDVIRILLRLRVNINEICNGLDAVQWVAKCGNLEALRLVLSYGANINVVDAQKNTLLHIAIQNRDIDVLRYLKKMGLKNDKKNLQNQTPLDLARTLPNEDYYMILERNPKINDLE